MLSWSASSPRYLRAGSDNKSAAIQLLRTFGSEEVLLKACYRRADPIFFWGGGSRLETAEARKLYYRVTGESFNENRREQGNFWTMRGGSSFDRDLGGEHVGQRIDEINLQESRLDGLIDPQSGTGYVEWTMVFRNDDARREHEARLLLSMPTGGVASRVTLWVNGEAREAAFGSKAKGSSHAQRVWLANQIRSLARHSYNQQARLGPSKFQIEIARIADRAAEAYLVTQLSGAVVLETDQQYKENDLEAGDPNQVPTVPEYKHFALIMGMASLTWLVGRRRRR